MATVRIDTDKLFRKLEFGISDKVDALSARMLATSQGLVPESGTSSTQESGRSDTSLAHLEKPVEPQIWLGPGEPSPSSFKPVKGKGWVKPEEGGFWTSSESTSEDEGWESFQNEVTPKPGTRKWRLSTSAKPVTIESLADLEAVIKQFPGKGEINMISGDAVIDYEAMAKAGYSGVRLTTEGQWKTRMTKPNLYGWDVESTLWFSWAFTSGVQLDDEGKAVSRRNWGSGGVKHRRGSARSKHKPGTLKESGVPIPADSDGKRIRGGIRYTARYAYYVEKGLGPGGMTEARKKNAGYLARTLEAHRDEITSGDWLKG